MSKTLKRCWEIESRFTDIEKPASTDALIALKAEYDALTEKLQHRHNRLISIVMVMLTWSLIFAAIAAVSRPLEYEALLTGPGVGFLIAFAVIFSSHMRPLNKLTPVDIFSDACPRTLNLERYSHTSMYQEFIEKMQLTGRVTPTAGECLTIINRLNDIESEQAARYRAKKPNKADRRRTWI